jgi:hypothetical protein
MVTPPTRLNAPVREYAIGGHTPVSKGSAEKGESMARFEKQADYISPRSAGTLHPDVLLEVEEAWLMNQPFTFMRSIRKGVDGTGPCAGSPGNYQNDCPIPVMAVQYVMSTGEALYYCREHALATNEADRVHYRSSAAPVPEMTPEQVKHLQRLLEGKKKRKMIELEEMEPD